jgi:hypothetical protein
MRSSSFAASTDDQIRNHAPWATVKRSARLGYLSAAVVGSIIPLAAESADDLKLPASFRHWYHVNTMIIDKASPLFEAMGGMHSVYINSAGEIALKKGGLYPDQTVFLVDLHEFTISDGSYVEGPRKATAIMLKDRKKMPRREAGASRPGPKVIQENHWSRIPPNNASNVTRSKKDQDYVYSTYIP